MKTVKIKRNHHILPKQEHFPISAYLCLSLGILGFLSVPLTMFTGIFYYLAIPVITGIIGVTVGHFTLNEIKSYKCKGANVTYTGLSFCYSQFLVTLVSLTMLPGLL